MNGTVKDPVCGMEIAHETAAASEQLDDETFFFCSHGCHDKFVADPHRYAHAAHEVHGQHAHH